jgi:hypothetical protein
MRAICSWGIFPNGEIFFLVGGIIFQWDSYWGFFFPGAGNFFLGGFFILTPSANPP